MACSFFKCFSELHTKHFLLNLVLDFDLELEPLNDLELLFSGLPLTYNPSLPSSLSTVFFFNSFEFKAANTSSIDKVSLAYIRVSTKLSYELGKDVKKSIALSSSSNVTSIFSRSKTSLLKSSVCSSKDLPDSILNVYSLFFRYNRFARDLVMYRVSNFAQTPAAEASFDTSLKTLSPRLKIIAL
ncbi:hypothetical protein HanIR_Chr13g0663781 [Helianthus annuus]|nr:hypothetical protein HanIR_Chr13g0663781 [Helianthus annuus]